MRQNNRLASAHKTPITIKPAVTSAELIVFACRQFMLMFNVHAATPTPRLTPSCCPIAAKLLARLMPACETSAKVSVFTAVNCKDLKNPPNNNTPLITQTGVLAVKTMHKTVHAAVITPFIVRTWR